MSLKLIDLSFPVSISFTTFFFFVSYINLGIFMGFGFAQLGRLFSDKLLYCKLKQTCR